MDDLRQLLEGIVQMGLKRNVYVGGDLRCAFEEVTVACQWWGRFVDGKGRGGGEGMGG